MDVTQQMAQTDQFSDPIALRAGWHTGQNLRVGHAYAHHPRSAQGYVQAGRQMGPGMCHGTIPHFGINPTFSNFFKPEFSKTHHINAKKHAHSSYSSASVSLSDRGE